MTRLILTAALFFMACNTQEASDNAVATDTTVTDDTYIATTPIPLAGCYAWAIKQDTATMELSVSGNDVTGTLQYDWNEKDRNKGILRGVIKDSLLVADYIFESEGMTSVREVAFKLQGNELVEGYGDYNTGNDTLKFKNITQLQFQTDRSFKKVDCKE